MEISAVGILGAGTGSASLAVKAAASGLQVRIYDLFKDSLKNTAASVEWRLEQLGKSELSSNIEFVQDCEKLYGAEILLETPARSEDERALRLNKACRAVDKSCLLGLCSGVEVLEPVTRELPVPERLLGIAFARPVAKNKLVELVRLERTSESTLNTASEFMRRIGKTPVMVKDMPGLIVERLRCPYHLAALRMLEVGKGAPSRIDAAAKKLGGFAMGPFESMDEIGLDVDWRAAEYLYQALGRPERLKPAACENRLAQYGQLGRKSTVGFYFYEDGDISGHNPDLRGVVPYLGIAPVSDEVIFGALIQPVIEEAHLAATEGLLSEYDVDVAAKLGLGWPKGPFALEREKADLLDSVRRQSKKDPWGDAV